MKLSPPHPFPLIQEHAGDVALRGLSALTRIFPNNQSGADYPDPTPASCVPAFFLRFDSYIDLSALSNRLSTVSCS